jgi:uncharacterized membrane protein
MRSLTLGIMAGLGIAAGNLPALAQSTTRIEPRPFYGATVIHPSDTFAGILAVADWLSRTRVAERRQPLLVRELVRLPLETFSLLASIAQEIWIELAHDEQVTPGAAR